MSLANDNGRLPAGQPAGDEAAMLLNAWRAFVTVSWQSCLINVLALTGSIFMILVYDRVLASYHQQTLIGLAGIAIGLFVLQGVADKLRRGLFVLIGVQYDERLMPRAGAAAQRLALHGSEPGLAQQPIRDVTAVREFMGSPAPAGFFDLPAVPIFIAFLFYIHLWLGLFVSACAIVLIGLTVLTNWRSAGLTQAATSANMQRMRCADDHARHAEIIQAMGFEGRIAETFQKTNQNFLEIQTETSNVVNGYSVASKSFLMAAQSGVLGLAAWLAINNQVSAGVMIAAMISGGRALSPIGQVTGHWTGFLKARQAQQRLRKTLSNLAHSLQVVEKIAHPAPTKRLSVENASAVVPQVGARVLTNISFELHPGQGLGVTGPSGSGKTSLARLLVGVLPAAAGNVRLDDVAVEHWPDTWATHSIGYLPQGVGLMDGTIAQNIARFDPEADDAAILAAAQTAGVDAMIKHLPDGYGTPLAQAGLAHGRRQQVALARALCGNPFLVVLDEPNSDLDAEGVAALTQALHHVRERGGIAVVMTHRPSALAAVDHIAVLREGQLVDFGPKDKIMGQILPGPGRVRP